MQLVWGDSSTVDFWVIFQVHVSLKFTSVESHTYNNGYLRQEKCVICRYFRPIFELNRNKLLLFSWGENGGDTVPSDFREAAGNKASHLGQAVPQLTFSGINDIRAHTHPPTHTQYSKLWLMIVACECKRSNSINSTHTFIMKQPHSSAHPNQQITFHFYSIVEQYLFPRSSKTSSHLSVCKPSRNHRTAAMSPKGTSLPLSFFGGSLRPSTPAPWSTTG